MYSRLLYSRFHLLKVLFIVVALGNAMMAVGVSAAHADIELSNDQIAIALAAQGVAFLNDNQLARLSNRTTSAVYVAIDIHNYFAYEDTSIGQERYNEAKASGKDPSKYLTWIAGDEQKRAKLVTNKRLLLLPYNTQVRVVKYQKDKLDDWYFQQTGVAKRLGRYQVQVVNGPNKDLKVWTQDVVDLLPHAGDIGYLGLPLNAKTPGGVPIDPSPIVGFDEGQMSEYWQAVYKGDDSTAVFLKNLKIVFSVDRNSQCQVVKEDTYQGDDVIYYQIKITDGPQKGKIVWTVGVSLTSLSSKPQPDQASN